MPSENGWNPAKASADQCEWVTIPGTDVSLQLLRGQPLQIMRAYAADYNAYVERLRDTDSAGWTPTNSVATSNHLNGTAMDLNWNSHPFQVSNAGYTPQMIATMREMLAFYEGTMFWAQDWDSPKDAMHHQMGYDTYGSPKLNDFIKRKIRADGYSTFRRGGAAPAPTPADADTELTKLFASRSPYRTDDKPFETLAGFILGIDRMVHQQLVEGAALRGERWAVDLVRKVAAGDVNHAGTWLWYPDSVGRRQKDLWAIAHAKAVLAQIEA